MISVIVPAYNVEMYIESCLNSILNQKFSDFEVIIVDDGSTDNTFNVCQKFKDERIKIFHTENHGLSEARNYGIEKSSGDYLTFIDSDDYISEFYLSDLMNSIEKFNSDISMCDYVSTPGDDCVFVRSDEEKVMSSMKCLSEILYQKKFINSAWGKLYKRNLFGNVRFPKERLFEDLHAICPLFINANSVSYTGNKDYAYRKREGSIMLSSKRRERADEYLFINDVLLSFLKYKTLKKAIYSRTFTNSIDYIYLNYRYRDELAFKEFKKARNYASKVIFSKAAFSLKIYALICICVPTKLALQMIDKIKKKK